MKTNKKSLRVILIFCFFIFSYIPVFFIGFYFLSSFEKGLNQEVAATINTANNKLQKFIKKAQEDIIDKLESKANDSTLKFYLTSGAYDQLNEHLINEAYVNNIRYIYLYDIEGRSVTYVDYLEKQIGKTKRKLKNSLIKKMKQGSSAIQQVEMIPSKTLLSVYKPLSSQSGEIIGYVQISLSLDSILLGSLADKYNVEVFIKGNGSVNSLSFDEDEEMKKSIQAVNEAAQTTEIKNTPYLAKSVPVVWGGSTLELVLASPQDQASSLISDLTQTFIIVILIMAVLLIMLSIFITSLILKPLVNLINLTKDPDFSKPELEIEQTPSTELGILIQNFKNLFKKVHIAQHSLNGKIQELEVANKKIKQTQGQLVHSAKMISLGELVAGVAHELNNPIGFIYSNMTHLKEYSEGLIAIIKAYDQDPKKVDELKQELDYGYVVEDLPRLIKSCEDGAQRTKEIVLGLRNFSRLDEAKQKEIYMSDALDDTLELLKGTYKNRVEIIKDYQDEELYNCYPSQLNQVFMNILSNAFQAIEGKGQVTIKTQRDQDFLSIIIKDTGMGMSKEVQEKVFDPFFTTKDQGKGTGLGLSISYSIIEKHNGQIYLKSEKNLGTEFTIKLPLNFKKSAVS